MQKTEKLAEEIKIEVDPEYKKAVDLFENHEKSKFEAGLKVKKNMSQQKQNFRMRLAERKQKLEQHRSGVFGDDFNADSGFLRKMPMSTRHSTQFKGGFGSGLGSAPRQFGFEGTNGEGVFGQSSVNPEDLQ